MAMLGKTARRPKVGPLSQSALCALTTYKFSPLPPHTLLPTPPYFVPQLPLCVLVLLQTL
jgi:hypothetical protein